MPQLVISDKIEPIVVHSQLDRQTTLKRTNTSGGSYGHPLVRGPFRVPQKRTSENKVVALPERSGPTEIKSERSKSAPRPKQSLKQALLTEYGTGIHNHLKDLEA